MTYEITLDREACDGVFACLVRDDRFVESGDGLATVDAEAAVGRTEHDRTVTVTVDDDRRGDAEQAAAACPVDAISVCDGSATEPTETPETAEGDP